MTNFKPAHIYIDNRVKDAQVTKEICAKFAEIPKKLIHDSSAFIKEANKRPDAISWGKTVLFLTENKGRFIKKCPGTKNYICCGYQILHPASQCNFDCSYCILQSYFNNPMITIFTNLEDMFSELDERLNENSEKKWRIGTGEFTDSLAFDDVYDFSNTAIPYFIKKENAILELKTKSTKIDHLLQYDPKGKIITAWSMNAKSINSNEEKSAASIEDRITAAQKCLKKGYKLAFHFDPIFYFSGWENEYKNTVDLIFDNIPEKEIVWISLGCFRFIPSLKTIVEERFPETRFIYGEFITGMDNKLRYPKPLRIHIYTKMLKWIQNRSSRVFTYLCMESPDVWQKSFGYTPKKFGSLSKALDARVFR